MYDWNNPALLARLNGNSAADGFNKWFGVQGLAAGDGKVEIIVPIRAELRQHHGYVHGGCIGALADMACAWAGAAASGQDVVTSNFTLHFLSPAVGDKLRAKARTIRSGRSLATVEAEVWCEAADKDPKLVATALASIAILPERRPRIS
ncbi:PaaI family thioesterase [Pseudooceanicola sp. MF1-13]|uniref:PaaI family thioesterase n=1 Tax=Pseudooceanicola sp. MF1-13 TaxID=3379095 RepID=UPI0038922744